MYQTQETSPDNAGALKLNIGMNAVLSLLLVLMVSISANADDIERGEYLTTILGCAGCHTEGALLGSPTGAWLAGSEIGIAYAEDEQGKPTAVVFPRNLTSDMKNGLGAWTKAEIIDVITTGNKHNGEIAIPVMPWLNYRLLKSQDVADIAAYLMSVPPVEKTIPNPIYPGEEINKAYVRIGVFLFLPNQDKSPDSGTGITDKYLPNGLLRNPPMEVDH